MARQLPHLLQGLGELDTAFGDAAPQLVRLQAERQAAPEDDREIQPHEEALEGGRHRYREPIANRIEQSAERERAHGPHGYGLPQGHPDHAESEHREHVGQVGKGDLRRARDDAELHGDRDDHQGHGEVRVARPKIETARRHGVDCDADDRRRRAVGDRHDPPDRPRRREQREAQRVHGVARGRRGRPA